MIERVLDTSFVIAFLNKERIDLVDPDLIIGGIMSAVNVSETYSKAFEYGFSAAEVDEVLSLLKRIDDFTTSQAMIAAELRTKTMKQGMGLGDRACVALGIELGADVYTAEHKWTEVELGCRIVLIRRDFRR